MLEHPKNERRKGDRLNCFRFVCSCTLKPEQQPPEPDNHKKRGAVLVNIGHQGICLETNFKPEKGSILRFEMRPIVGPEVTAIIRVLHTQPSTTNGFHLVGSEFAELTEEHSQNLLILLDTIGRLEEGLTDA